MYVYTHEWLSQSFVNSPPSHNESEMLLNNMWCVRVTAHPYPRGGSVVGGAAPSSDDPASINFNGRQMDIIISEI